MVTSDLDMKRLIGKRLTESEIQVIKLIIEKSKVKRERASLLINKGITLYFSFLIVGVLGLINEVVTITLFNTLVLLGFGVLLFAAIPYIQLMRKSEMDIDAMLDHLFH